MNVKTKKAASSAAFIFLNIHLRGRKFTDSLIPNNHQYIKNHPVGVVFGQYMTHWTMLKHIFNHPENTSKNHYSSSWRINEKKYAN